MPAPQQPEKHGSQGSSGQGPAATYLHALDVDDCHDLDDPVGNEAADIQLRYFVTHASGWHRPTAER